MGLVIKCPVKLPGGLIDGNKAPLKILEVDAVGSRVHERHEQMMIDLGHRRWG